MLSSHDKTRLYVSLLKYRIGRKKFNKRKLAVGLIRFEYVYQIYDNKVLSASFQPSIKQDSRYASKKDPIFITKQSFYSPKWWHLLVLGGVYLLLCNIPIEISLFITRDLGVSCFDMKTRILIVSGLKVVMGF